MVVLAGLAIAATPAAGHGMGATLTAGSRAQAPSKATVPNVVGSKRAAASTRLRALGLRVVVATVQSSMPAGTVVAQRPRAKTVVGRGTTVRLTVAANGPIVIPNVVGLLKDDAEQKLSAAGLVPSVDYVHSLELVDTVVEQQPGAGARVAALTRVRIAISSGPGA